MKIVKLSDRVLGKIYGGDHCRGAPHAFYLNVGDEKIPITEQAFNQILGSGASVSVEEGCPGEGTRGGGGEADPPVG